jgi:hypothetical protein
MNNLQSIIPQSFLQYLDENQFRLQWMKVSETHAIAHILDRTDDNIFIQFSISSKPSDLSEFSYKQAKKNLWNGSSIRSGYPSLEQLISSRFYDAFIELHKSLSWHKDYPLQILENNSYRREYIGKLYCDKFFCLSMNNKSKLKELNNSYTDEGV